MKKLSEYKGIEGIEKAAAVMEEIMVIVKNPENAIRDKEPLVKMYITCMKNNPHEMMNIFALLNDADPKEYSCTGEEAVSNVYFMISDSMVTTLFVSQVQRMGATSSGPASKKAD